MYTNNFYNPYVRRELELYHHGIFGMKWGKKNGPPYPLDASDHSASEKKAGWRKSLDNGGGSEKPKKLRKESKYKKAKREFKESTAEYNSSRAEFKRAKKEYRRNKTEENKAKFNSARDRYYNADADLIDKSIEYSKRQAIRGAKIRLALVAVGLAAPYVSRAMNKGAKMYENHRRDINNIVETSSKEFQNAKWTDYFDVSNGTSLALYDPRKRR